MPRGEPRKAESAQLLKKTERRQEAKLQKREGGCKQQATGAARQQCLNSTKSPMAQAFKHQRQKTKQKQILRLHGHWGLES